MSVICLTYVKRSIDFTYCLNTILLEFSDEKIVFVDTPVLILNVFNNFDICVFVKMCNCLS